MLSNMNTTHICSLWTYICLHYIAVVMQNLIIHVCDGSETHLSREERERACISYPVLNTCVDHHYLLINIHLG